MNIIQLQDRLKGLPDQALVKYVEQPMGEVPIYLALGELQRRKEMKERFQATQADKPSVAEQLVAEAKPMQMGLGAMAPQQMMPEGQGVGAPQPAPEIDPRQMAASGIAANPQSAVGGTAMMKEGGIVGYQPGGFITGDTYPPDRARIVRENALGKSMLNDAKKMEYIDFINTYRNKLNMTSTDLRKLYENSNKEKIVAKNLEKQKETDSGFLTQKDFILSNLNKLPDGEDKTKRLAEYNERLTRLTKSGDEIKKEEEEKKLGEEGYNAYEPYKKEIGGIFGMAKMETRDEFFDAVREDKIAAGLDPDFYKTQKEEFDTDSKESVNMALIKAGLGIMGGTSANALENIAAGALPAIKDLESSVASHKKEQRLLDRASRLETLGDIKGYRDKQKEIRAIQLDLLKKYHDRMESLADAATQRGDKLMNDAYDKALKSMKVYGDNPLATFFAGRYADYQIEFEKRLAQIYERMRLGETDFSYITPDGGTEYERTGRGSKKKKKTIAEVYS